VDGQLSWASHIDKAVVRMGRGMYIIKICSAFFDTSTVLVVQDLVLFHLYYCPVTWSSAAEKDLAKLQLAQNRVAHLAFNCTCITNISNMHASLSWLKVDEK
jgi:hypothetical protein